MNLMQVEKLNAKQIYQQKVETHLGKLDAQIIVLNAKIADAKANAKNKHFDKVVALSARQQVAQMRLHLLKSANEDTWQELKVGVESALHELQEVFNTALAQLKQANEGTASD